MDICSFTSLVGKLNSHKNYRTWAKDMEVCLIRNACWTVVTSAVPAEEDRNEAWLVKAYWARGEIHLSCEADIQDIILDSKHAPDS